MTTPLATISDALIEFILSLLRDPATAEQFAADPQKTLDSKGLGNICVDDVRAVVPVVVDHPSVSPRPPAHGPGPDVHYPAPPHIVHPQPPVIREIHTIANKFHVDARTTIVDQSVNQNIWAKGDVTQHFDQKAVLAVGDGSVAAGGDALIDNSATDITAGDIAIGNTETNTTINDSLNDASTNVYLDADTADSFNDSSTDVDVDVNVTDSFQSESSEVVETTTVIHNDGNIDMTSYEGYPTAAPDSAIESNSTIESSDVPDYGSTPEADPGFLPPEFDDQP